MFRRIPIAVIDIRRLEPPYERKGRVTPVTGMRPTTTIRFKIVWNEKLKVIPKAKYFEKLSSFDIDILIP